MDKLADDLKGVTLIARESHRNTATNTGIIQPNYALNETGHPNEFSYFFHGIFERLDSMFWVFSDTFRLPSITKTSDAEMDEAERIFENELYTNKIGEDYLFYHDGQKFLTKYSRYIRDDWNSLFAFEKQGGIIDFLKTVKFKVYGLPDLQLMERIHTVFYNFDGYSWSCFSRDSSLVSAVMELNLKDNIRQISGSISEYFKNR